MCVCVCARACVRACAFLSGRCRDRHTKHRYISRCLTRQLAVRRTCSIIARVYWHGVWRWGIRSCACPCLWRQRKCRLQHGIRLWQRLLLFWRALPLRLWCRGGHGRGRCCERRGRLCVWRSCVLGTLLPPLVVNCEGHLSAPACTALFSRASARCSLASARCLAVMRPQRAAACDR